MPIQWFPGHMHLTRQAIGERIKGIDVVIELLDARLPGSSENPLLNELTRAKPKLKLLNKQDLADIGVTEQWLAHYNARPETKAMAIDASNALSAKKLIDMCRALAPSRVGMAKPLRVLVCGIPNVGKSTLINSLMNKRAAKTGDEAGITRTEQRIALARDFHLYDTPGVLWPRISLEKSGYNLAASGAVGRNAYDDQEVALELLGYLVQHYAQRLAARYDIAQPEPEAPEDWLENIARQRGALQSGGRIDPQKASELVIGDFRHGEFGRVSLETPEEFGAWQAQQKLADEARASRKRP